jgi:hypothetical protein
VSEHSGQTPPASPHPRHDPEFCDRCIIDLLQNWGRWRLLGRLYAAQMPSGERCCVVREAVDHARRIGFEVEDDPRLGYRVVGFHHVSLYLAKPGRRPALRGSHHE